jgi:hypothetical protein
MITITLTVPEQIFFTDYHTRLHDYRDEHEDACEIDYDEAITLVQPTLAQTTLAKLRWSDDYEITEQTQDLILITRPATSFKVADTVLHWSQSNQITANTTDWAITATFENKRDADQFLDWHNETLDYMTSRQKASA